MGWYQMSEFKVDFMSDLDRRLSEVMEQFKPEPGELEHRLRVIDITMQMSKLTVLIAPSLTGLCRDAMADAADAIARAGLYLYYDDVTGYQTRNHFERLILQSAPPYEFVLHRGHGKNVIAVYSFYMGKFWDKRPRYIRGKKLLRALRALMGDVTQHTEGKGAAGFCDFPGLIVGI